MMVSQIRYGLVISMVCFNAEAIKEKKLIDIINVCKRNDPKLSECFCTNLINVLPKIKDGAREMNIVPIDPAKVDKIKVDLTQSQSVKLGGNLENATIYRLSQVTLEKCDLFTTSDGPQLSIDLHYPELEIKSLYKAVGIFLLVGINTTCDFQVKFTNMRVRSVWNSTRYMKNNMQYLNCKAEVNNLTMEKMALRVTNLFGNHTHLNEEMNQMFNENAMMAYHEVKPVIWKIMIGIIEKVINDFHGTFPYDLLYPTE